MTMDEKYVEDIWKFLKTAFQQILSSEELFKSLSFEELYRHASVLVLHGHGDRLYSGIQELVTEHLVEKVCNDVSLSHNDNFLDTLNTAWSRYQVSMVMIRDVVMLMDRKWSSQNGLHNVFTLGLVLFRDLVSCFFEIIFLIFVHWNLVNPVTNGPQKSCHIKLFFQ
ncbi:cullin-3-B-like [Orbicella faveolata]|uniref:cullin-3-B-like n=1 Tax=Orbicella faveolata TaxID=48498 RepID=UPI0009E568C8|nr:cullin-3-B-like [Orbicella faveolata]